MICRNCELNETNNPDGICDYCKKVISGIFSSELAAPPVKVIKSGPLPKKIYQAKDTSSKFEIQSLEPKKFNFKTNRLLTLKTSNSRKKKVASVKIKPPCFGNYQKENCRHCIMNSECKTKTCKND